MKQGGIYRTAQMAGLAESAGLKCVIGHGFGMAINTLAEIHVAASCKNIMSGCEFVGPLKIKRDVVERSVNMNAGVVRVPDDSGLGAELDEAKLKECIQQ
jgi:muconate cycloisomerase